MERDHAEQIAALREKLESQDARYEGRLAALSGDFREAAARTATLLARVARANWSLSAQVLHIKPRGV
jgi:hypothetical protein